jgi:cullin-associated NEDD8-dissociated protein 1
MVSVMIKKGTQVGYFTYVRQPCVRLTFFEDAKARTLTQAGRHMCGNMDLPIGNPTCCRADQAWTVTGNNDNTAGLCHHINERVDFATSKSRCESIGFVMCQQRRSRYPGWDDSCGRSQVMWSDNACHLKVQIYPSGRIALVDNGTMPFFMENHGNQFRVRWENGNYPKAPACGAGCNQVETLGASTCVCRVATSNTPLFSGTVPSARDVLYQAAVGAAPISSFDSGAYSLCSTAACTADGDLKVWVKSGVAAWDTDDSTIFEVSLRHHAGDPVKYFKNQLSTVSLAQQTTMKFRNPPAFMPVFGETYSRNEPWRSQDLWKPAAENEVEALIDHLFHHDSTAPFVCYRMIQRLVTANPSLRYVKSVVNAFKSGRYNGKTYSGRYGDMAATVAAVLLDQEARSPTVEADPRHGSLQEPMLKVVRFLRSLEFKTKDGREIHLPKLDNRLAQMAFKSPSVFGFYLPEFRPDGAIEDDGLVGPVGQVCS